MSSRYVNTDLKTTDSNSTLKVSLDDREVKTIRHYQTLSLKTPTREESRDLRIEQYFWKSNDTFWRLSSIYYSNPKYWWVIAWWNKKPIEATVQIGQAIEIPQPLSIVLDLVQ